MERSLIDVHTKLRPRGEDDLVPRTVSAREAGVLRYRRVRTYPQGNLRDQVARCESLEELGKLVEGIRAGVVAGAIPPGTARKIQRAVDVRKVELQGRRVIVPGAPGRRTRSGLYLP